jgi:hypothetical protein
VNSYVRAVDEYVHQLPLTAQDAADNGLDVSRQQFQMRDFASWCSGIGYQNIADRASMALGQHREAWIAYMLGETTDHPRYILGRHEWGGAAWWYVMEAPMALPQLRQTCHEVARRAERDILARVMPAAQLDPSQLAAITAIRRQVAVNFLVLAQIVQGQAPGEMQGWATTP